MTDAITQMDATRLAGAIASRELSPVEVMQAHLDRIAEVNPKVNAIVTLAANALDTARKAEAGVKSGAKLGPLHGVPFTVKDSLDTGACRRSAVRRSSRDAFPMPTPPPSRD